MLHKISFLFMVNFFSALGYSLIAPLFPAVAKSKGVNDFMIGVIFSSFAISNVAATLFISKFINFFGRRKLFILALLLEVSLSSFL